MSQTKKKESRDHEVNMKSTTVVQNTTTPNISVSTGTTNMFYKTRICQKFIDGFCRNGDKCNFAHGPKDLREPPPNWQEHVKDNRSFKDWNDDQKIIKKMRICKKFYDGDECPYGEKCAFLHESPDKFKIQPTVESGKARESVVIKVETVDDRGRSQTNAGQGLHTSVGSSSVAANAASDPITTEPLATGSVSDVPDVPPRIGRGFLKLANKKLVGIYADWISDDEEGMNTL